MVEQSTKTATTRNYVGMSKVQRIEQRRILLIETAMRLSDAIGWRNLNVDRLCQAAQLNKRYFYENFNDLDSLAAAVIDHVALAVSQKIYAVIQPTQTVAEMAYATIHAFVHFLVEVPCRARLIFGELSTNDSMAQHRKRLVQFMVNEVTRHGREIHQPDNVSDATIETCALFLIGGTGQVLLNWLDTTPADFPIEKLINHLTALWLITGNGAAEYAHKNTMNLDSFSPSFTTL